MSSANVELVRSMFAAWERGGELPVVRWARPEIEFVFADGPSPGTWTGPKGLAEGLSELRSVWEAFRVEVDEYRELDDERVLVLVHRSGRGKASGLDLGRVRTTGANLVYLHEGTVSKFVIYFDRERALADLGLAPRAGSTDV
jgi:ketosteroid isomerase-like protein